MNENPYQAANEPDSKANPHEVVSTQWLVFISAVLCICTAVSIPIWQLGWIFPTAVFVGLPVLSLVVGHGRRQNQVATTGISLAVGFASVIVFLAICTIGVYRDAGTFISTAVCTFSMALSCAVAILLHRWSGVEEPPEQKAAGTEADQKPAS